MAEENKPSIFKKIMEAGEATLDQYIFKARSEIAQQEDDAFYRKSIYKDITYSVGSQGYHERTNRLSYSYLNHMAKKNTIVATIIQTRQNQVSAFTEPAKDKHEVGFQIVLKNEEKAIDQLLAKLFPEKFDDQYGDSDKDDSSDKSDANMRYAVNHSDEVDEGGSSDTIEMDELKNVDANEDGQMSEREMRRYAKTELLKRTKKKRMAIQEMVMTCGSTKDRPFESRKWDFDALMRAWVRDTYTYDQICGEIVPDNAGRPHHWVPVDGGTIRYSSPALGKYKDMSVHQAGYDILFPEKELKAMELQRDAVELDDEKLENDDYKFVQVVRGRIIRAFTPDELFMGMRNPTTDLYSNGYSVAELEILLRMISAHIFTENYNRSYFTQGFSAKGILHIKAPLNRRKLESIRVQWQHMIKGNKNSFQTPIMSGMDDIKWIPLTQNHSDMEFSNWMNYLIKIICSVYQIDPAEIGFGMREEGGRGTGGLGGDQLEQKVEISKSKGLAPLLRFFETVINKNIVDRIDPDYKLKFVGISEESRKEVRERQKEEVRFKKSVNEIREEDDLPPIPGCDDLVLDPTFFQWFTQFHPDGKQMMEEQQGAEQEGQMGEDVQAQTDKESDLLHQQIEQEEQGLASENQTNVEQVSNVEEELGAEQQAAQDAKMKKSKKVAIEYYTIDED